MKTFTRGPVRFQYPAGWAFDTDADDGAAWAVSASSPDTAFVLVSLHPDAAGPGALAEETLAALRVEYTELDADPVVEGIGGQPAVGYDVDFLTVDTPTVCLIRSLSTPDGPLLLMAQVSEYDREANEPLLRAVLASVTVEDE
jgi:hypothetical protein